MLVFPLERFNRFLVFGLYRELNAPALKDAVCPKKPSFASPTPYAKQGELQVYKIWDFSDSVKMDFQDGRQGKKTPSH